MKTNETGPASGGEYRYFTRKTDGDRFRANFRYDCMAVAKGFVWLPIKGLSAKQWLREFENAKVMIETDEHGTPLAPPPAEPGETPMTDDARAEFERARWMTGAKVPDGWDFSRTLERENAALSAEVERLRAAVRLVVEAEPIFKEANADELLDAMTEAEDPEVRAAAKGLLACKEALRAEAGKEP